MKLRYLNTEGLVKVTFILEPNEWHGYSTETMWAERINEYLYKLRNVPFYTKGISVEDDFNVVYKGDEIIFKSIVKHNGHSTYRIMLDSGNQKVHLFEEYWRKLEDEGCSYEKANDNFYAIDVSPNTDIHKIYQILEEGELESLWEFEEGHCGHQI